MKITFYATPPVLTDNVASRFIVGERKCEARSQIEAMLCEEYNKIFEINVLKFLSQWGFQDEGGAYISRKKAQGVTGELEVICKYDKLQVVISASYGGKGNAALWPSPMVDIWSNIIGQANYIAPDGTELINSQLLDDLVRKCGLTYMPYEMLEGIETCPDLPSAAIKAILQNKGFSEVREDRFMLDSDGRGGDIVVEVKVEGLTYTVRALLNNDFSFEQAEYIVSLLKEYEK
jgi:hypothetical protein